MMPGWWCWSWGTGVAPVSADRRDVLADYLYREPDVPVPASLKKLNVIDEGWKLLDFKNEKVGQFIEKGYRTAPAYRRLHHHHPEYRRLLPTASTAARAAWVTLVQGHPQTVSQRVCQI
jgi:hypothetical protein